MSMDKDRVEMIEGIVEYNADIYGMQIIYDVYNSELEDTEEIWSGDLDDYRPDNSTIVGYVCPECGDPVYFEDYDWSVEAAKTCPICEYQL